MTQFFPFQFEPVGQAHALVAELNVWPAGQTIQVNPFHCDPDGQEQDKVCTFQTRPVEQEMHTNPFQLEFAAQTH